MLIAKIENGEVVDVSDYQSMFPDTSFTASGPNADWLSENNCMPVNMWLPYDQNTQKLVPSTPYIDGDWVYTVVVEPLTPEEIAEKEELQRQSNKHQAKTMLQQTDWVEMPSVSDTSNTPHLTNYSDFMSYRIALRSIAVNPPVVAEFPAKPDEVWSQ